jgi:pimeloyl-ACP methyl ester carboxylesterase
VSRDKTYRPRFPTGVATGFHDGVLGRIRSRALGDPQPGMPEIVMVQGLTVSDYLLPGLGVLSAWTRVHLVDLPGCSGSGEPPHELAVEEFAQAVADWLIHRRLSPVILAGHSSGTQVAAEAARMVPGHVAAVVLASPTIDPAARGMVRVLRRWWVDRKREPTSLDECHSPERKRVGFRRLLHMLRAHLRHAIEEPVAELRMPVLVIRGRDDAISTPAWASHLATLPADGRYVEVPGAHTFCWRHPAAWSTPIRALADQIGAGAGRSPRSR